MEQISAKPRNNMICCFCKHTEDNEVLYGKFHLHEDIMVHYFCLLLSSNIEQNGADDEGILGFLPDDIRKELTRSSRSLCHFCCRSGATVSCSANKCKKMFHLPCGLKKGSLHQFFGQYRSFCNNHRPPQRIRPEVLKSLQNGDIVCTICLEEVPRVVTRDIIWAPCCRKNSWFHRNCIQTLALSSGYFFKCPQCNDKSVFEKAMLQHGIFIPERDASWERVPNAYEELLHRHGHCDAPTCKCPKGREFNNVGTRWEVVLCKYCGSQGVHKACGRKRWNELVWECPDCIATLQKLPSDAENSSGATSSSVASPSSVSPPALPPPQPSEEYEDIVLLDNDDDENVSGMGRIVEVTSVKWTNDTGDDDDDVIIVDDSDSEDGNFTSRANPPPQPAPARNTSMIQSVGTCSQSYETHFSSTMGPYKGSVDNPSGPLRNSMGNPSGLPGRNVGNPSCPLRNSIVYPSVPQRNNMGNLLVPPMNNIGNPSVPPQTIMGRMWVPPSNVIDSPSSRPRNNMANPPGPQRNSCIVYPSVSQWSNIGNSAGPPRNNIGNPSVPPQSSKGNLFVPPINISGSPLGPPKNITGSPLGPPRSSMGDPSGPLRCRNGMGNMTGPAQSSTSNLMGSLRNNMGNLSYPPQSNPSTLPGSSTSAPTGYPRNSNQSRNHALMNLSFPAGSSAPANTNDFLIAKDGAAIEVVHLDDISSPDGQPLQVEGDVNVTTQPSCGSMMFMYQQPIIVQTMPTATAFIPQTVSELLAAKKRRMQ